MPLSPAQSRGDRWPEDGPLPDARRWIAGGLVVLSIVVVVRPPRLTSARAAQQAPAQRGIRDAADRLPITADYERLLAGLERRLTALAQPILAELSAEQERRALPSKLSLETGIAESNYQDAKLVRQVAEIAAREYDQGVEVQELTAVEAEIKVVRAEVERAEQHVAEAKKRLERISALADQDTASGLSTVYLYTDQLELAEVRERQARNRLAMAETRKGLLTRFTIQKNRLDRQSEVAKAHAEELAKQAAWELAKEKERALKQENERAGLSERDRQILALIDRAMAIEEKLRAKLAEADRPGDKSDDQFREVGQIYEDLAAIIDHAESLRAIDRFAVLKPRLQQAARQNRPSTAK